MAKPGMFISRMPSRATPRRASRSLIRCASETGAVRVVAVLSAEIVLIASSPPIASGERALPQMPCEENRSREQSQAPTAAQDAGEDEGPSFAAAVVTVASLMWLLRPRN